MKKTLLVCSLLVGSLLISHYADAQVRVRVNINARPAWEHRGYDRWDDRPRVVIVDHRGYGRRHRDGRWERDYGRYDERRHGRRYDNDRYDGSYGRGRDFGYDGPGDRRW